MSDSSDSSKPRPKTAAVPHYTVGEEIMNSVTHGVGCLLGIAGLVLLIVFAALRGGGPAHMAAAMVKKTCVWITSDARPGVMRPSMAM